MLNLDLIKTCINNLINNLSSTHYYGDGDSFHIYMQLNPTIDALKQILNNANAKLKTDSFDNDHLDCLCENLSKYSSILTSDCNRMEKSNAEFPGSADDFNDANKTINGFKEYIPLIEASYSKLHEHLREISPSIRLK